MIIIRKNIAAKLSELVKIIFNKANVIVSLTADDEGYSLFSEAYSKLSDDMGDEKPVVAQRNYTPVNVKTAYTAASQVQYVARCGNLSMLALSTQVRLRYLRLYSHMNICGLM